MISGKTIRAAFLSSALMPFSPAFAQDGHIEVPPLSEQNITTGDQNRLQTSQINNELDKAVYRDQLIQAWHKDPQLYQAMRDAARNPRAVTQWKNRFDDIRKEDNRLSQQTGNNTTVVFKTPGDILESNTVIESAERDAMVLAQQRAQEDAEGRSEILNEWGDAQTLASQYTDLMYAAKGGTDVGMDRYLVDFVEKTVKPQNDAFPEVAGYDQLMTRAGSPADVLARLNLSVEDVSQIRSGKKTVEQVLADHNMTKSQVRETLIQVYQEQNNVVQIDVRQPKSEQKLTRGEQIQRYKDALIGFDKALADKTGHTPEQLKKLKEQRDEYDAARIRLEIDEHKAFASNARAYTAATTSVATLLLGPSEEIQDVSTAVNAGIDLYESVGSMLITGALDPTGIATAASAINVVTSLFGPKKADPMAGMLRKILENQRIMLEKLTRIENKVDVLLEKTEEIIGKLDAIERQIDRRSDEIILTIEEKDRVAAERAQLIAQSQLILDEEALIGNALKPFRDRAGKRYESAVKCVVENACDDQADRLFERIHGTAGTMYAHAVRALNSDIIFRERRRFLDSTLVVLREDAGSDAARLVGQLSDMASWINARMEAAGTQEAPLNATIFERVGHPYYLTDFYIPQYVRLISHLPENYDGAAETPDDREMMQELDKVKNAAAEARRAIPKAISIHASSYRVILDALNSYIDIPMNDTTERPTEYFGLPQIFADQPDLRQLFLSGSDNDIRAYFDAMGARQFADFGVRLGLFTIERRYENLGSKEPGNIIVDNAEYAYIQLTPKAQAIFGGPLDTSYWKGQVIYTFRKEHGILTTGNGKMPQGTIDKSGDFEMKPSAARRKPVVDIFVNELLAKRQAIVTSWNAQLVEKKAIHDNVRLEAVRASLAASTFIDAGYGSCAAYLPELEALRTIKSTLADESLLNAMQSATDLPTLHKAKVDTEAMIANVPMIPQTPEAVVGCSLGWGDLPKAEKAIEELKQYSSAYTPGSP